MNYIHNTVSVNNGHTVSFLHISDTHLTFADDRDGKRKTDLAERRTKTFPDAEQNMVDAGVFAEEHGLIIAHTGDLIDFVSQKNLEAAARFTSEHDVFMSAGNHEFSLYVGEAKEDAAYRNRSLADVQSCFKNDIRFSARIENGIKFIAVDNSYYLLERKQLDALQRECADGMPVILFMHTPLYTPDLYEDVIRREGLPAYLMAVPEEKMHGYSAERYEQQKADATTQAAYDFILSCDAVKAVFAGHIHHDYEGLLPNGIPQFVTGLGSARIVQVQ